MTFLKLVGFFLLIETIVLVGLLSILLGGVTQQVLLLPANCP